MPIGTLFLGSTGKDVELLQQALFGKKFYSGLIDGAFDAATEQAVIAFQRSADLKPDGVAGPITLGALGLLGDTDKLAALRTIVNGGLHGFDEFSRSWARGAVLLGLTLENSLKTAARQIA